MGVAAVPAAVFVQAEPTIEGVPWWWYLIGAPILGFVLEMLRRRMKDAEDDSDKKPRHRPAQKPDQELPTPPDGMPKPPSPNASAAERSFYVEQLIAEITRSRDEAERELKVAEQTIARLTARIHEQDVYMARLAAMYGVPMPGPSSPPRMMPGR